MSATLDPASLARWRVDPVGFIEQCLIDPETKKPFVLLPAEREFLKHAFTLDEHGRLMYPELLYSCPKKSGKTAFAAIIVLTLIWLFGGAYPEAVCCANDLDQAQGRVFAAVRRIVECSPLLRREAQITQNKITFPSTGATITAIGSDYAGAAGANQNIAVFDEAWAYTSERSHRLWDEMVPPPTRKIACRLCVTYAGFEGESTLLEELHRRGLQQQQVGPDLYAGDGLLMFWSHMPVAPWQDERWLTDMRRSLRPAQYLRMIENRFVTTESSFVDMSAWDACVDPNLRPVFGDRALPIYVGIDASVKHDSTAIVVVHWDKKSQRVRLIWHRVFQPSPDDPLDFERTIERTVIDLHKRFNLRKVLFDPYQMQAVSQRLAKAGVRIQEFSQTPANLTEASQNLFELIQGRNLMAYPDANMRLAISRAVALETSRGWRITKEKQSHKIDVVIALAMAAHAAVKGQNDSTFSLYSGWLDDEPAPPPPKSPPGMSEEQYKRITSPPSALMAREFCEGG
jgi:phage terminase large subunit-like protein